jgi:hypothetical protein
VQPSRVVADATPFDRLPQDYSDESRRFLDYEPWIDLMVGGLHKLNFADPHLESAW